MPNRRPSARRTFRLAVPVAAVLLALAAGAGGFLVARAATFTDQASVPGNTFITDTLAPPTGLTATVVGSSIRLDWTPTTDTYASGYKVMRSTTSGGGYGQINTVTPRTATTYTDSTAAAGTRYYYVLQTYFQSWLSVYSNEANAAVPANTGWRSPTAQAAVTSNSGDNNGFQTNPTNAFADGGGYAEDPLSGTASSQDCASTGRDRHRFYNYGFTIPSGQTINGIEVRLDAWADSTTGSPKMCVELSWDGGTTWTTAKTTANLTTSEQTYTLGSTSDTWGRTWSSTQFSDANFRVRITNCASSTSRYFRLDWVAVRVTYTPPLGFALSLTPPLDSTLDPTPDPTLDPTPEPTPDPTLDPTPEPTPEPTPDPTLDPTPDPTLDPTPDPTLDPTLDPTPEPTPDPTLDPTPDPTLDPTPEPTPDPTLDPTPEPMPDPTPEPTPDRTLDPTPEPTPDPTLDPTPDPTPEPTPEPTLDPTLPTDAAPAGDRCGQLPSEGGGASRGGSPPAGAGLGTPG